ncbi:MAG: hypothetical protein ABR578_01170 [Chromatocurvus sp.]
MMADKPYPRTGESGRAGSSAFTAVFPHVQPGVPADIGGSMACELFAGDAFAAFPLVSDADEPGVSLRSYLSGGAAPETASAFFQIFRCGSRRSSAHRSIQYGGE